MPRKLSADARAHKNAYDNQYRREKRDNIYLSFPAGTRDTIQQHASGRGESVTGFITRAIKEQIKRDLDGQPAQPEQPAQQI